MSRSLNSLTLYLNKTFKSRIRVLIKDNEQIYQASDYFDKYLLYIHNNNDNIFKFLSKDKRKNNLRLNKQYENIRFEFVINKNLNSSFSIIVSKMIRVNNDAEFLINKITPTKGYVYILECEYGYKIGCTSKLMERIKTFGVLLPFKFTLHSTIKCYEFKKLERKLHNSFNEKRMNGEWFDLNEDDFKELDSLIGDKGLERILNKDIKTQ